MARVFFFHYNKPASKLLGSHKLSFHTGKVCHIVDRVVCKVPTESRTNKRQPYVVMKGRADRVDIVRSWTETGLAYLTVEVRG